MDIYYDMYINIDICFWTYTMSILTTVICAFRKTSHTNQDESQVSQDIAANKVSLSAKFIVFWILPDDEINIAVQRCKGTKKTPNCCTVHEAASPSVRNVYAN